VPEQVVVRPGAAAPVPPFGGYVRGPEAIVPGAAPEGVVIPVSTPIPVEVGPAFNWSTTDNYLILGTDRRPADDSWRTDTIIVVGLDRTLNRAAVLSVPRDLYIDIPNYGYGRINQADYIGERILKTPGGGPALVSSILSDTLGIATTHWLRFEMTGFIDVVNAVGGVTVSLDCPFYEPIFNLDTNSWEYFTLPAGDVFMDGDTAYWFVRLRLRESDIGRSSRQRQFLWALRNQVLSTNLLPRVPQLWTAFRNSFSTDLTLVEMLNLLQFGLGLDADNVRAGGITLRELQSYTTERGASVLIITDPARVQAVVEGIWTAPAMADAYRQNSAACPAIPEGVPVIASADPTATPSVPQEGEVALPEPTPVPGG
jgi:LCP family protein required for cell wall assembly